MTEEKELNEKLAKWAGFKPPHPNCGNPRHMMEPETEPYAGCVLIPNFTNSLDAIFKWLVPKTQGCSLYYYKSDNKWRAGVGYNREGGGEEYYDEDPALALCRAIEKLIDGH